MRTRQLWCAALLVVTCVLLGAAEAEAVDVSESRPKAARAARAKVAPRIVPAHHFVPKHRIIMHPKQQPVVQQPPQATQAPAVSAGVSVPAPAPVLRATVPNSAACQAKGGACADPKTCAGTLVRGLCAGTVPVCCVPSSPAPQPPATAETFSKAYLLGKFDPATHPAFVAIGGGRYIRKETWAAYKLMNAAAIKEIGVELTVLSATRNFDAQKAIWDRKWTSDARYKDIADPRSRALGIMEFSSMPSTSQHHWGTSFDLWSLEPSQFTTTATGKKLDAWFAANAARFGFCRPFSPKPPRVDGYNEEQWHVSYKPLLKQLVAQYRQTVTYADITGFSGSNFAQSIGAIEKYVFGIDPACLS